MNRKIKRNRSGAKSSSAAVTQAERNPVRPCGQEAKPVVIDTTCDMRLSVQTVTPYLDDGKTRQTLKEEFCLLVEGELYQHGSNINICVPVTLNLKGALDLGRELDTFIITS